jgi:hypothetical protein
MMTREGGAQPGEYLAKYASDRVRTVAITWLGSTMGCAECHDHKYDPFTQRDFYSLSAFFADVKQWGVYSDYDYTPNPELKDWTNDHPFPPEIEVESPYLKRRLGQLRDRIRRICSDSTPAPDALDSWVKSCADLVRTSPGGWKTPASQAEKGAKPQPDGSLLLADPAGKEGRDKQGESWKFRMKPGAGGLARIRLELLPHPIHGGKVARGNADSARVSLSASIRSKGSADDRPLTFFYAEADLKEPRYANTREILDIRGGWQSSRPHKDRKQTAIWYLERPVVLAADDELTVVVRTDGAGCIRLSVSPFGFDPTGPLLLDEAQRMAILAKPVERTPEQVEELKELYLLGTARDTAAWGEVKPLYVRLREFRDGRTYTMITKAARPPVTRVLPRGNWQDQSGTVVEPAVPHFLPQPAATEGVRLTRLDLARWLTSGDNPLTSRAFVNRLWKQLFGTGISSLVEDLGAQGEWPVHPELLDWLAIEFRDGGWDVKHMVKLLVMSAAYRQDSRVRPELRDLDPNNRLVAFQSPRRLEAEFVRDNALAVAGLLNLDMGGPSVFPYQPPDYYANLQFPDRDYIADRDDRQYRRGVYMHWQRTFLQPMLANFDAPPREECTAARTVANTPQQALTVLNDPTFVEAARALARSLMAIQGESDAERLNRLYEKALARPPREHERQSLLEFLSARRSFFRGHHSEAGQLLRVGNAPLAEVIDEPELAAWTTACRVVLGLHETISRY